MDSGWADPKFEAELTGKSDAKFWSCVSEALVYKRLLGKTFATRATVGAGPDFLLEVGQKRLWIEVICPESTGVPPEWLHLQIDQATSMPHEAMLLRWTSAIKAKTEQLAGRSGGWGGGFLGRGIVSPEDIYVVAVNGCRLRNGPFSSLHGISQFPFAAEAVFPIGPYQIHIDKETLRTVGAGHQQRFTIPKPNGASVPSHAFLDPSYRMVSAIWAVDFDGSSAIGNPEPSALIHNPNAVNPLPRDFLPADEEFAATPIGTNEMLFERIRP